MNKDIFRFESKLLRSEVVPKIVIEYNHDFFYINNIPHTCINFSNSRISFIFDTVKNEVKCYGIDVEDNILLPRDVYELLDEEDKSKLYDFLNNAQEFLNHLEVNKDFDYVYEFESLYEDNHIQSARFIENFKEANWHQELLYSDSVGNNPPNTEAYKVYKDDKCFYYFEFTDYFNSEVVVKYNDDVKEEVEDFFYKAKENRNRLYTTWLVIFIILLTFFIFLY